MSKLGGARTGEISVDPGMEVAGLIALACSLPFLLVAWPSIAHHDPFVLAHAGRDHLSCSDCSSIQLMGSFTPRAVTTLTWEAGIDISGLTTPAAPPGFEPLAIRGTVGRTALTKVNLRLRLEGGKRADEAMRFVDHWVAHRPELVVDKADRAYFVERGALPRE